tara:strand:- start:481 stop:771 length:291 start_codon:yes stop_codon:yes gene_type:complete
VQEINMSKIVYVVTGSEDGILGVYGNKKGAYNKALWYVHQDDDDDPVKVISYAKVCKELKNVYQYSVSIVDDTTDGIYHYSNASIHAVLFNEKERK